jgi:hypothetical protein
MQSTTIYNFSISSLISSLETSLWPEFIGSLEILKFYPHLCVHNLIESVVCKNFRIVIPFQKPISSGLGLGVLLFISLVLVG